MKILILPVLLMSVLKVSETRGETGGRRECRELIIQAHSEPSQNHLRRMTMNMINLLRVYTAGQLPPDQAADIQFLADRMRQIFLADSGVYETARQGLVAVTAGSGFATLDAAGEPENLFGIYRANTPEAARMYPFAPSAPGPVNGEYGDERVLSQVAGRGQQLLCMILPDCRTMQHQVFLNISNRSIFGDRRKRFFDGAVYLPSRQIYSTFRAWHPGGEGISWPEAGKLLYDQGQGGGKFIFFRQPNLGQDALMYLRPFEGREGSFAGVAYSFTWLRDELLVNQKYRDLISDGICPGP